MKLSLLVLVLCHSHRAEAFLKESKLYVLLNSATKTPLIDSGSHKPAHRALHRGQRLGTKANDSFQTVTFRAALPPRGRNKKGKDQSLSSYYQHKIEEQLLQYNIQHATSPLGGLEFSLPFGEEDQSRKHQTANLLRSLPATQLFIVVARWAKTSEELIDCQNILPKRISERAIITWQLLGNTLDSTGQLSFHISTKFPSKTVWRRNDNTLANVSEWISSSMQWRPQRTISVASTLSFRLTLLEGVYSLELLAMDRTWPLPVPDPSTPPSITRVESFMVAKSAAIQPYDVVWDPFCQRGTFLVEAAKYWPTAIYHGTDSNMGHLEHCQMNAQSTSTLLHLHYAKSTGDAVNQLNEALVRNKMTGVDKILTLLPSNQSVQEYCDLLRNWTQVMQPTTRMVLIVSVSSLQNFRRAVNDLSGHYCITSFRNPSFLWGKKLRVTLVIVQKIEKIGVADEPSLPSSRLLDWEEGALKDYKVGSESLSASMTSHLWARVRAQTIPWMIPCTQRKVSRSKIRLPNGEFL
jgi:hypothetical protein